MLCSVSITIGGELANQRSRDNVEMLYKKGYCWWGSQFISQTPATTFEFVTPARVRLFHLTQRPVEKLHDVFTLSHLGLFGIWTRSVSQLIRTQVKRTNTHNTQDATHSLMCFFISYIIIRRRIAKNEMQHKVGRCHRLVQLHSRQALGFLLWILYVYAFCTYAFCILISTA